MSREGADACSGSRDLAVIIVTLSFICGYVLTHVQVYTEVGGPPSCYVSGTDHLAL